MVRKLAAGIIAALTLVTATGAPAQSVDVQYGNLVYRNASGESDVLTETGADGSPAISPSGTLVAFTRQRPGDQADPNDPNRGALSDVYIIRVSDHALRKIVTAAHSSQPENEVSGIHSLTFSPDGTTVYFSTAAWTTSGAIHAVPVQGGRERFVTSGNGFVVVQRGKFAGYLVTSQHQYMEANGSWNPYVLVSPEGKEIKVLGEFGFDKTRAEMAALQSVEGTSATPAAAASASATSPGYAEKVQRRIRPNIVWSGETQGLETVLAVRSAPSGTLLSVSITRSSGSAQWDTAALRAVQRSDPVPLDVDGKAPAFFTITLRPVG
ncbi:TonB family protein [Paraburkholderia sp. J10-1]|uniref:TonB family protein n=1 Tax=Paraburkholderia sp. J10-1 TaxID=2805430 RepID=UPI002AB6739B|nr:TonB family protein [Paraburkholderia sp. J10-1]